MESLASQAVDDPSFALGKRSRGVTSVSEHHKQLAWIHTRLFGQQQLETVLGQGSNAQLTATLHGVNSSAVLRARCQWDSKKAAICSPTLQNRFHPTHPLGSMPSGVWDFKALCNAAPMTERAV